MRRSPVILASALACGLLLSSCSGGSATGCTELREPEDPQSGLHVIDPAGLTYATDPPTSGPHAGGPAAAGIFHEPLLPAVQVRVLESGGAMIQYDESVSSAEIDQLADLATGAVVLAPSDADLPSPVVITAWTWKLTCETVDAERIETFIADRPQGAPGAD